MRRRWHDVHVPLGARLLWGMALLSLLLLPTDYRAGADAPHGHSLIQLWVDASDGRVDHHAHHEVSAPGQVLSTSWFDPAVAETQAIQSIGLDDGHPDFSAQHESAFVSGVDLIVVAAIAITILRRNEAPGAPFDQKRIGLPARIFDPPPRWTAA